MKDYYILVINCGSTSTQVGLYKNQTCIMEESISHTAEQLKLDVDDQTCFRKQAIMDFLDKTKVGLKSLSAVSARGGRLKPIPSGTYLVNDLMIQDSYNKENGNHASRLSVLIGKEIAKIAGCEVYAVDPISVDEMIEEAKISGMPEIERKSLGHALNMKAVARKTAKDLNKNYNDINVVVAHLGGGTTISSHRKGQMIDLINDFEGVFTPERAGGLPNLQLVKLCFSGKYNEQEIIKKLEGSGGFFAYLETKSVIEIEQRIKDGDNYAKLIMDSYIYQLTKIVGSMVAVLEYKVDAISFTGSIAKSKNIIDRLTSVFSKIAPISVYPGSFEMEALSYGVLRVLQGLDSPKTYPTGSVI